MSTERTALVTKPAVVRPLQALRGSVLVLHRRFLRERRLYDGYEEALPAAIRAKSLGVAAAEWVPVELAGSHYEALGAMGLTDEVYIELGKETGERIHGEFLNVLLRLAGKLGATPWHALQQVPKLWERSHRGGATSVYRLGEHSAEVQIMGLPPSLSHSHAFRSTYPGAFEAGLEALCHSPKVRITGHDEDSFSLLASWT